MHFSINLCHMKNASKMIQDHFYMGSNSSSHFLGEQRMKFHSYHSQDNKSSQLLRENKEE